MLDASLVPLAKQLLLVIVLGAVLGVERELTHKPAGIRTHTLVAFGAALFAIISSSFAGAGVDPTRIAAQVVSGIGFLGAGIIIFHDSKVQGLTTAAGIWVAAAIGMAVGFQLYSLAILGTVLTLVIFLLVGAVEKRIHEPGIK